MFVSISKMQWNFQKFRNWISKITLHLPTLNSYTYLFTCLFAYLFIYLLIYLTKYFSELKFPNVKRHAILLSHWVEILAQYKFNWPSADILWCIVKIFSALPKGSCTSLSLIYESISVIISKMRKKEFKFVEIGWYLLRDRWSSNNFIRNNKIPYLYSVTECIEATRAPNPHRSLTLPRDTPRYWSLNSVLSGSEKL